MEVEVVLVSGGKSSFPGADPTAETAAKAAI
jgi:hypothetical protein